MDIKILEKNDRRIKFILTDSNPQFANALRRTSVGEVPILSIDFVDFSKNDSVFYDEIIAHRLGLIPLVFDVKDFNLPSDCKCDNKGCVLCQTKFALNKKGPCTVYSGDLKSANKAVKVLYDNIPIVILKEGQNLRLEATAVLGLGKDHAKWQSSVSHYIYYPADAKDLSDKGLKKLEADGVEMKHDDTKFIFWVESASGLTAEKIVLQAIDGLKKKAKEFERKVKKL